jgi:hypothetical protein
VTALRAKSQAVSANNLVSYALRAALLRVLMLRELCFLFLRSWGADDGIGEVNANGSELDGRWRRQVSQGMIK